MAEDSALLSSVKAKEAPEWPDELGVISCWVCEVLDEELPVYEVSEGSMGRIEDQITTSPVSSIVGSEEG